MVSTFLKKGVVSSFVILFIFVTSFIEISASKLNPSLKLLRTSKKVNKLDKVLLNSNHRGVTPETVKIAILFKTPPSESYLNKLESIGVKFNRLNGRRLNTEHVYGAEVPWSVLDLLEKEQDIESVSSIWKPKIITPLDLSVPEIEADHVWQFVDFNGDRIDGTGVRVANFDTGIDAHHPGFFRADGLTYNWIDFNGNSLFDPGIDAVDLNNNSSMDANEILDFWDGAYHDPYGGTENEDGIFQVRLDWVYNDANTNGSRDWGTSSGFTESDPAYGELVFIVNDTNGNNTLDLNETLTALNTSRIFKTLDAGGVERTRGIDLIQNQGDFYGHGTGVCGVISSEIRNKREYVSVAPGCELLVADRYTNDYTVYMPWARNNGASVMLYEYSGFVFEYLDGSSPHELAIDDEAVNNGIIHITPAGNLAGSSKHMSQSIPIGDTDVRFFVTSGYGICGVYITFLWREDNWGLGGVNFTVKSPGNKSLTIAGNDTWEIIDGHDIWSYKSVSGKGTYAMDIYIYNASFVDINIWTVTLGNISGTSGTIHGYIADDITSWGGGAIWVDSVNDYPTICWPGTSDVNIVVGSYSTRGISVPVNDLSGFSSRGNRIDGAFIMDITAPGNYDIRTIASKDQYGEFGVYAWFGGTSAAGPHVAAAAALLKQTDPTADHFFVEANLQYYALADSYTGAVPNSDWGYGKLRLQKMIDDKISWDYNSNNGVLLFPEWSNGTPTWGTPSEKYISYIKGTGYGTCDVYVVNLSGIPEPKKITQASDNVNHNSQISWSPDDEYIIFASTNESGNLNIFRVPSDPDDINLAKRITPSSGMNWGRWLDPDWGSALNQTDGV